MEAGTPKETKSDAIPGFALFLAVAFFGTLAAVMLARARMEGGALVLGVLCGVGASIPASLLAVYLGRRHESTGVDRRETEQPYPPLVIINGPPPGARPPLPDYPPVNQTSAPTGSRPRYRVIGDE